MCGIVGYLGKGEAYPALIKGLKRLEYRGYDSAGVALISNGGAFNPNRNAYRYNANSGTIPTNDKHLGSTAALIRTVGWGQGNNATGSDNAKYKTVGQLYLGVYDEQSKVPNYGIEFKSRPREISFYYKYQPVDNDKFIAEVILLNVTNGMETELAKGTISIGGTIDKYISARIVLNYTNMVLKVSKICVIFKAGTETKCTTVPKFGDLSDGEYVGSQLYIDDVELIYDYQE